MTGEGAAIVIKISGRPVDDPGSCVSLWRAIAERSRTSRLLLVHGGGAAVDRHLARLGETSERAAGLRVTPPTQIGEVAGVLAGRVNKLLVSVMLRAGVRAAGVSLGDGGLARVEREMAAGVDLGCVGRVAGGDPSLALALWSGGFVPVVSSIGIDPSPEVGGGLLNVNADDAASGLAAVVGARRVLLLTDVPGILDAEGRRLERVDAAAVERLIADGVVHGGMIPKVRAALAAATSSGVPAVIGSWNEAGALLGEGGAGTVVVPAERRAGARA